MPNKTENTQPIILGIFIGVSEYASSDYQSLPTCLKDLDIMYFTMSKIKKFTKSIELSNESSQQVKLSIQNFFSEYKEKKISEIFFYFSGHGERIDDEFYFVLSDFDKNKPNSTGLGEFYIDKIVRELQPEIYTKISDACYSGTRSIKNSEENSKNVVKKQIEHLGLKNVYYFFSSSENQPSYADKNGLSYFTDELISSIISTEREFKYVDLAGELSDAFRGNQRQQEPIFCMQGSFEHSIGNIQKKHISAIMKHIGIDDLISSEPTIAINNPLYTNLERLTEKSNNDCLDEKKIDELLSSLHQKLKLNLDESFADYYDITLSFKENTQTYSTEKIGSWLEKNNDLFAIPSYSYKTVKTKYYDKPDKISLPKRSGISSNIYQDLLALGNYINPREQLVLKEKNVEERYISGFEFTVKNSKNITNITLMPKHQLLPKFEFWFVFIYSHEKFYIHNLFISQIKKSWHDYKIKNNSNWSVTRLQVKDVSCENITLLMHKFIDKYVNDELTNF